MRTIARHKNGQTTIWGPHATDDHTTARNATLDAIAADENLTAPTVVLACIPGGKK